MVRIIELLVAVYCFIGMVTGIQSLTYVGIGVSLLAQILALIVLIGYKQGKRIPRTPLVFYVVNLVILLIIALVLLMGNTSTSDVLNRMLSLLSIFGLSILFCIPTMRIQKIIKTTLTLFTLLGSMVFLDSMGYLVFGSSIWPPESYLGNRFSGPFFDPNFLSITYAVLFIVVLFNRHATERRLHRFRLILFAALVLLGGSWSVVSLLLIGLVASKILRNRNYGTKQIAIVTVYCISLPVLIANLAPMYGIFESTAAKFGIESPEAAAKFRSFEYRIVAQHDAMTGIIEKPLGYGPQSLVPNIGRDTHNSYLGFTYELGLFGLGLLLLNMSYRRKRYDPMTNTLTTFFFLVALTINVHYTSLYLLILLLVRHSNKSKMQISPLMSSIKE